MLLVAVSFVMLALLPYDFDYLIFAVALFIMGMGNGMFASPNSAAIMNSVPPSDRGVASGMMSTLMNSGFVISMGMFFSIIVFGLSKEFPGALASSLTSAGAAQLIPAMSAIPPTGALFAAFLGYNPVQMILTGLPLTVTAGIAPATIAILTSETWFPTTLAQAFMPSLALAFYTGAAISVISAVLCAMRGEHYVHEIHGDATPAADPDPQESSGKSAR
jgi:MFS family permease